MDVVVSGRHSNVGSRERDKKRLGRYFINQFERNVDIDLSDRFLKHACYRRLKRWVIVRAYGSVSFCVSIGRGLCLGAWDGMGPNGSQAW